MAARETLRLQAPAPKARPTPQRAPAAARLEPGPARRLPHPLPLDAFTLRRLDRVQELAGPGRYLGWGRESESRLFFVDLAEPGADLRIGGAGVERHHGESLHAAIGAALEDLGASR